MEKKIQDRFVYTGFGFPVVLLNVPVGKVRGTWTPLVDYNKLQKCMVEALAYKPVRLTGHEIHFIRTYFKMTLVDFGDRFSVSHPAVIKWENAGDEPTAMNWVVEKDIRIFILDCLSSKPIAIVKLYRDLQREAERGPKPIEMKHTEKNHQQFWMAAGENSSTRASREHARVGN